MLGGGLGRGGGGEGGGGVKRSGPDAVCKCRLEPERQPPRGGAQLTERVN